MTSGVRIDIDGYNLALEEGTGVATYGRNLTVALAEMGVTTNVLYGLPISAKADDLMKEVRFFDPQPGKYTKLGDARRFIRALAGLRAFEIPITGKVVIEDVKGRLPRCNRTLNVEALFRTANDHFNITGRALEVTVPNPPQIMHWTYPVPVKVRGAKNIYTLHDLVPLKLPYTTLDKKTRYLALMRLLAREADHLVTVSEASRRDIIELLGVPEDRVTNTYQAADLSTDLANAGMADAAAHQVIDLSANGYFLFVGAIEPKKNVGRLIEGFLAAQPSAKLVIVGKKAWKWKKELALVELMAGNPQAPVIHLDYVPFPTLVSLIRGAKAMVFPSLYEGFGLPVLEALQLGTPVITANTGSLPEVAGDAALMVDPYDATSIAQAITTLDRDAELRATLIARGKIQAAKFSHAAYRERLADLYRRLGADL